MLLYKQDKQCLFCLFFILEKNMIDTSIVVSVITGGLSLAGVILTNMNSNRKIEHQIEVHQAVTETKLQNLTDEVRFHNDFARRVPVIEKDVEYIKQEIRELKGA